MKNLRPFAILSKLIVVGSLLASVPAFAADAEFKPRPETYICPNVLKAGVDCFLDAVEHLYTMCRHVKSIEVVEFGLEHSEEGVNGAKSEYCVDKHKSSITRFYQAALKDASSSKVAVEGLKSLHTLWLNALAELKWKPPESSAEYQDRVGHAYDTFHERESVVRTALAEAPKAKSKTAANAQRPRKTASAQHAN